MPLSPDVLHTDIFGISLFGDGAGDEDQLSTDRQRTRFRILDTGVEVAARDGYRLLDMREIAVKAGVSLDTIYQKFPSPVHLFIAALSDELAYFDVHVRRAFDGTADPSRRLSSAIFLLLDEMQRSHSVTEALTHAYAAAQLVAAPQAEIIRRQTSEMFAGFLSNGIVSDRHRMVADVLTDVWTAEVVALVQERRTYAGVRRRLDTAIDLLAGNPDNVEAQSRADSRTGSSSTVELRTSAL